MRVLNQSLDTLGLREAPGLLAGLPYSPALFEAQTLAVARGPWQAGRLSPPSLAGAMLLPQHQIEFL